MKKFEPEKIEERLRLRAAVIYQIIRIEGEDELRRPVSSLWWSGVSAGFGISVSIFTQGLLHLNVPDSLWGAAVENLGYCLGFLIVVLGRLQLFTENTITAVLPLMAERTWTYLFSILKLWGVVFFANIVGTFLSAVMAMYGRLFTDAQLTAIYEISYHLLSTTPAEIFFHAIPAGFLVAAMVWLLPSSKGSEFWVIIALTYPIALGSFSHVIAGSTEVFLLLLNGRIGIGDSIGGIILPALGGNVIGGTVLFSLLAYGQVHEEIEQRQPDKGSENTEVDSV